MVSNHITRAVVVAFGLMQAVETGDITGTWQGTLQAGRELRTVLKISKAGDAYKATLYSIDQGAGGMNASTATFQPPTFKFSIIAIDGTFEGKLSPDGSSISGTWSQAGHPLPLNLKRATPQTAWVIPEPPPRMAPMAADADPAFEVATIKPSKPDQRGKGFRVNGRTFTTINTSMVDLMTFAYGIHPRQIVGGPTWFESDKFDLEAKPDGEGAPSDKQWKTMVQKLLADRFKLTFHHAEKELSVYALVVGKTGPKMAKSDSDQGLPGMFFTGPGRLSCRNASMKDFSGLMQATVLDRPVVNQTELAGKFDFQLVWTPDETQFPGMGMKTAPPADPANAPPSLFTAIQEQLGLKLDATKAMVEAFAIDHVEKPSAN